MLKSFRVTRPVRWTLETTILAGFGLALALLVIVAMLAYRSTMSLLVEGDFVKHTYQVIERLDEVFANVQDAESGRRGYILTNDMAQLGPYHAAVARMEGSLKELRELTRDNSRQQ